ncbi:hypothetical protein [Pseudoalteromonas sp. TAB23]|uniref:hypothetical protein n=1 Tax=Pseudoalteromonas sp. TAB23 TaxID=1938595 RepID=UPI000428C691|nr:hypothetical protein [Pseudoalteromonas sp. TAB23]
MKNQCTTHENSINSCDLYLVAGRVCDCENEFKLVSATSAEEAEDIFEKYVRGEAGIKGNDFYIEHCQKISEMNLNVLTINTLA